MNEKREVSKNTMLENTVIYYTFNLTDCVFDRYEQNKKKICLIKLNLTPLFKLIFLCIDIKILGYCKVDIVDELRLYIHAHI